MKKILLIQPKSPETFWQLTGVLDIVKRKSVNPPLGLATVAAITPKGYDIKIIDEEIEDIDFDTDCDIVGMTGYTIHSRRMFELAAEFRKRGKLTIAGGPYCTGHPHECRDHFDVLICGEAEYVWPKFLADYDSGNYSHEYIELDKIHMPDSPIPRWDLVALEHYSGTTIQTSRGCPYDCEFCDVVSLFGQKMRYKGYDQIIEEIKYATSLGRFDIFLADDNFIGNKKFVRELLRRIIELNKSLKKPNRYFTQVTLNVAQDEELLDMFQEANFYCFFIGIETPKEESLVHTNKAHNAKLDMKASIRRIQSRGIFIVAGMIVGFDTDDLDIFQLQKDFLAEAGLAIPMLGMLVATKGTKLWNRMEKEGRLFPELEEGDAFNLTNITPKLMAKSDLEKNYAQLLSDIYSIDHFKTRFESLLEQVDIEKVKRNSPLSRLMEISNFRFFTLGSTIRTIKHYLFHRNKNMRKLFTHLFKLVWKKGMVTFPWLIELLVYFKAEYEFVEQHDLGYQVQKHDSAGDNKIKKQESVGTL